MNGAYEDAGKSGKSIEGRADFNRMMDDIKSGKLIISVLSAVAEIERENIRVQTMEGRWNGGFAPYGYQLVNGNMEINEEETVAIRVIFEQYVDTDIV